MKTAVELNKKMTMKKKLVWRLSKLPSVEELRDLVKDKIITQEEAREVLFSSESEEDRDESSLKAEIKFLKELVEKLSSNRTQIVEIIKEIRTPYIRWKWQDPYWAWCNSTSTDANNALQSLTTNSGGTSHIYLTTSNFSNIKTF